MNPEEYIGLLAGILGMIAWFPQIYKIWVKKKADGISLSAFSIITLALLLWLVYVIIIGSISLIVSNSITLLLILIILIGAKIVQLSQSK